MRCKRVSLVIRRCAVRPTFRRKSAFSVCVSRAHAFHYSGMATDMSVERYASRPQAGQAGKPVFRSRAIAATYMHGYWPSNPAFAAALFEGGNI